MTYRRSRFNGKPNGQIAATLAVSAVGLFAAVALAADVAVFYSNWSLLQKAADAAVLAGANFLPTNPDFAIAKADEYAVTNGIASEEIVDTVTSEDNLRIQIRLQRTVPYFFARVAGLDTGIVQARATAGVVPVGAARGLIPIGIDHRTNMTPYQTIELKQFAQTPGPGNWKPLALGNPGADVYRSNIMYGYQTEIAISEILTTETGNIVGPTDQAITFRIEGGMASDPSGTSTVHNLNNPRIVQVPIVDFTGVNGNSQVPVLGFAVLWLMNVQGGNITTQFIRQVTAGDKPSSGAPPYGSLTVSLLE